MYDLSNFKKKEKVTRFSVILMGGHLVVSLSTVSHLFYVKIGSNYKVKNVKYGIVWYVLTLLCRLKC